MNLALLQDNVVINIIWVKPEQQGDFPNGVSINGLPVKIGDTYDPGTEKFYRNGQEVSWFMEPEEPEPTPEPTYTLDEAAAILAQEVSGNGYDA